MRRDVPNSSAYLPSSESILAFCDDENRKSRHCLLVRYKYRGQTHLREAAARYQADLLLVYRTYCRSFERYRFFSVDRSKAYCGVEAVLLDTRTGLVPFTSVALESYEATENEADINFRETVLKAQLNATADALAGVVGEIVAYLAEY